MACNVNDYRRLVVEDVPLIDVRAPGEFAAGAFPTAVNLPLLDDDERRQVGTRYAQAGQYAAIELGHGLVCGSIRERRIAAWRGFAEQHPGAIIYCFRGGLRSQIVQQWLEAEGLRIGRLDGGYKAFRLYLIEQLDMDRLGGEPLVVAGRTGSGKTKVVEQLAHAVDLEALAVHRGSSFGRRLAPQPTQIDFENRLAWALVKHAWRGHRYLVVEDEGANIGRRLVPRALAQRFASADLVLVDEPLERRVRNTLDEYVVDAQREYGAAYGAEVGMARWIEAMAGNVEQLAKRLGDERCRRVKRLLLEAFARQRGTGDAGAHSEWIGLLLREYYDPMYDYQLARKTGAIRFAGTAQEALAYLQNLG